MYRVHLQQFEGPLDLLLFFIRRDELDIYDIPIARIADEYLAYVRILEQIDLDGVGDFLYMAALLIHIKARMLLPSREMDEEGDPVDPRQELVERLLAYIRYKEASEHLEACYEHRSELFTPGHAADSVVVEPGAEELVATTVFDLISALRRVLTEAADLPVHAVVTEAYSIEEQQEFVLRRLAEEGRQAFSRLVAGESKACIIATFLAVLELAREARLLIRVVSACDFFLEPGAPGAAINGAPALPKDKEGR